MDIACLAPADTFDYTAILAEQFAERTDRAVRFEDFSIHTNEIPEHVSYDGLVITGSKYHVYDAQDWVNASKLVLRAALADEVPILGICYGHQLLADTLGGTVRKMDDREMGYREIELTEAGSKSNLLGTLSSPFMAFTSHLDHVSDQPHDTTVLAENEYGIQAFRSEIFPAWGTQFHPEYDLAMAQKLLETKDMSQDRRETIEATLTEENDQRSRKSRAVFDAFIQQCR